MFVVGCRIVVVNNNPTKCATTRSTNGTNLDMLLVRGGGLNNIYLGRKYVPAGALLCSTGACSDTGRTSGCTVGMSRISFSLSGVVIHGDGIIHGLMLKIGTGLTSGGITVMSKRTRVVSGGAIHYNRRACRNRGLVLYANSRAFVPPVPKIRAIGC